MMQTSQNLRPGLLLLLFVFSVAGLWAQDTRGGLAPDTVVLLADGSKVLVQDLRVGNLLMAVDALGKPGSAKLEALRKQHSEAFLLIKTALGELKITGSQRVALAGGALARAEDIKVGDRLQFWGTKGPQDSPILSLRVYPSNLITLDLTTNGHGAFIAGGFVVLD